MEEVDETPQEAKKKDIYYGQALQHTSQAEEDPEYPRQDSDSYISSGSE